MATERPSAKGSELVAIDEALVLSDDDLRTYLRLNRSPLAELGEDENWRMLGRLQVSKKHATFRAGFAHPILASTRFALQEFDVGDAQGCAVVLLSGGKPPAYFAGWVPSSRTDNAVCWVDTLNRAIQLVLPQAADLQHAARDQHDIEVLTCHFGREWAPDAPWGEEIIRLMRGGAVDYMRRQRGEQAQHLSGRFAPGRFDELALMLTSTSFPEQPEKSFPPGASICTIVTDPKNGNQLLRRASASGIPRIPSLSSVTVRGISRVGSRRARAVELRALVRAAAMDELSQERLEVELTRSTLNVSLVA